MRRITPLMTSLHEGHKAEERLKCIDDMLVKCEDTKFTVLQAFYWYRKYTKANSQRLEKIEQIIKQVESMHPEVAIGDREGIRKIKEVLEQE